MAFPATVYNVLFASPSDLIEERRASREAVQEWNDLHADAERAVLLPMMWETHSTPEAGDRPQAIINRQLVSKADLLVGLFWTKVGTHTGEAESGTVEEINQMLKAGKQVMLYYSDRPARPSALDLKQMKKLREFKLSTYKNALSASFTSPDQLRQMLMRDLTRVVRALPRDAVSARSASNDLGIKVKVDVRVMDMGSTRYLIVDVLNDGIELNGVHVEVGCQFWNRDKGEGVSVFPHGKVPDPFKTGFSASFSLTNQIASPRLQWDRFEPSDMFIVVYSTVCVVAKIPATEWLDAWKVFTGPFEQKEPPTAPASTSKPGNALNGLKKMQDEYFGRR